MPHDAGPLFFEDVVEGTSFTTGVRTLTEGDIVGFAREWDPQPFHLDPAAARGSLFGTLVASGLHTLVASFKLFNDLELFRSTALAGAGIENLRFIAPVRPGEALRVTATLSGKRPVRNPARGLVTVRLVTTAGADRPVLDWELLMLVARRTPAGQAR